MVVSRITNDGAGGGGGAGIEAQPGDQEAAADTASRLTDSDIEKIAKNVSICGVDAKLFFGKSADIRSVLL